MKLVYSISTTDLKGVWEYQTDDEHKPRWVCSNCGCAIRKDR